MHSESRETAPITLPGGRALHIRALRPGEDAVVRELFARLSARTRYFRFLAPMRILPESVLRTLTDVDDSQRLALVAELDGSNSGDVVGLGNVIAADDGPSEVGLVVADAWQRRGIGIALAMRLLHAAEVRGHSRFLVHERWDNRALRRLLQRVGEVVSSETRFGVSEITFVRRRSAIERAYERILATKGGLLTR